MFFQSLTSKVIYKIGFLVAIIIAVIICSFIILVYFQSQTGGPVDTVKDVTLSHTTGGRVADIVVLRSATQKGLSGQANTASLSGNFTSSDFIRGPKDMSALVKDILSGNVIIRVDTLKYPLGIVAGTVKPNL